MQAWAIGSVMFAFDLPCAAFAWDGRGYSEKSANMSDWMNEGGNLAILFFIQKTIQEKLQTEAATELEQFQILCITASSTLSYTSSYMSQ